MYSVIYTEQGADRVWTTVDTREEAERILAEDCWGIPGEFFSIRIIRNR